MYREFDSLDGGLLGVLFIVLAGLFVVGILYVLSLQKALDAISPENRLMPSGQVWLLLILLFNLIWAFIVAAKIADSFRAEFNRLNIDYAEARPTYGIGMAKCSLSICGILPGIGSIASLASFICWIIYWTKVNQCRKLIEANRDNMLLDAEAGVFHGDRQSNS
jgi:hypothetical protein